MDSPRIRRILVLSIIIGGMFSIASIFVFDGKHFSGVLCGAIIGSMNFYFLVQMVIKMLEEKPDKFSLFTRFVMKYFVIMALAGVALVVIRVSPLGFMVGISNFVIAVPIGGLVPMKDNQD